MPFPDKHACIIRDRKEFDVTSFVTQQRSHNGKPYDVIMGHLAGEKTLTEHSYHYPLAHWTADEARAHCKEHYGISFEPATNSPKGQAVWGQCGEQAPSPSEAAGLPSFTRLPHLAARLFDTPLAIEPRKLRTIIAVLSPRFGLKIEAQEPTDMTPKKRKP